MSRTISNLNFQKELIVIANLFIVDPKPAKPTTKMIFKSSVFLLLLPAVSGFTAHVPKTTTTKLDAGRTLYDKIFDDHTVTESDGSTLL